MTRLDGETRTILVVEAPGNRNLELASRNLEGVKLVAPAALQPYDLLRHDRLMLSKDAALHLGRTLGPRSGARRLPTVRSDGAGAPAAKPLQVSASRPAKGKAAASRARKAKPAAKPKAAAKTQGQEASPRTKE